MYKNIIKNIYKIINNKKTNDTILLGRWGYTNNINQLNKKIYLANYDNCGPCGMYYIENKQSSRQV